MTRMSPIGQEPAIPGTTTERASDAITKMIGSTAFLLFQVPSCAYLDHGLGIDVESAKHEPNGLSDATDVGKLASELEDRLPDR